MGLTATKQWHSLNAPDGLGLHRFTLQFPRELETEFLADSFEQCTILFADVVGFTQLAAELKPEQLLSVLNRLFTAFDVLAERHGLEKIKTIGDAYMAVGGAPVPREDDADAAAEMALGMLHAVDRLNIEFG